MECRAIIVRKSRRRPESDSGPAHSPLHGRYSYEPGPPAGSDLRAVRRPLRPLDLHRAVDGGHAHDDGTRSQADRVRAVPLITSAPREPTPTDGGARGAPHLDAARELRRRGELDRPVLGAAVKSLAVP